VRRARHPRWTTFAAFLPACLPVGRQVGLGPWVTAPVASQQSRILCQAVADLADRARFDFVAGRFRGYAWGENVGWINLDDAVHFVALDVRCGTDADCVLADADVCTCDECAAGSCVNTPSEYGDVDCQGPEDPDLDDILCVLDGFADFAACPNGDIHPPCTGNNLVDIDDILAVLDAFAGNDPCACAP
jgi:hypothetical protein